VVGRVFGCGVHDTRTKTACTKALQQAEDHICTLFVFDERFSLEECIGSHAYRLEASVRVIEYHASRMATSLPVDDVNYVAPLKDTVEARVEEVYGAHLDRNSLAPLLLNLTPACLKLLHACDQ
jgi:hypothetical protein